jgi:epoxyqueuosine reductase
MKRSFLQMNSKMQAISEMWGADFFGVADLSPAQDAIASQGGSILATYPLAISVGMALPHTVVDQLPHRAKRTVAMSYRHNCFNVINQRLDLLISQMSSLLQREGFRAWPVPSSQRVDDERLCGVFSHKLAAHLAGLGWIGKNCLLVTPEVGPRVRWASVLTDAPLVVTGKPMEERCGSCNQCVLICPVQAFTGEPFRASEPRDKRYDAGKCDRYFETMRIKDIESAVCGLCLYVCPHGKRRKHEAIEQ